MDTLRTPCHADSPALLIAAPAAAPYATVITQAGQKLELWREGARTLTLAPPGRLKPYRLDPYQAAALHQALGDALAEMQGYRFERGQGR